MKKGFTLVELLIVIAVLGILAVLVVPDVIANYNKTIDAKMKIEEDNVSSAAKLFVQDCFESSIGGNSSCNNALSTYNSSNSHICLNHLNTGYSEGSEYIDEVEYKNDICKGVTFINQNKYETYLCCGTNCESYSTENITNEIKNVINSCYN